MRRSKWLIGCGLVMVLAGSAGAQQGTFVRTTPKLVLDEGAGAYQQAGNALIGTARDSADEVIAEAHVQLRNLRTGTIDQAATTNAEGAFAFRSIEPGTYVVEMTLAGGGVAALSEATTVGAGEVVQTLVRLTARTRSFGWWMGSTANSAVSQAASVGVLTVEPGLPVTPGIPNP